MRTRRLVWIVIAIGLFGIGLKLTPLNFLRHPQTVFQRIPKGELGLFPRVEAVRIKDHPLNSQPGVTRRYQAELTLRNVWGFAQSNHGREFEASRKQLSAAIRKQERNLEVALVPFLRPLSTFAFRLRSVFCFESLDSHLDRNL
jgi:hypothetical protein